MAKSGYIYLICDPATDLFKIGLTTGDIHKRMKKLQTGNGTELHLAYVHYTDHPYKLEKMLHNHFASKKTLNEWFALESNDLEAFNDICLAKEDIIASLKDNPFFND